jgi:hypothetical protein
VTALTDQGKGEEMADGRVAFWSEVDIFWYGKARLFGVGNSCSGRQLTDEGVAGGDLLAKRVEEDA